MRKHHGGLAQGQDVPHRVCGHVAHVHNHAEPVHLPHDDFAERRQALAIDNLASGFRLGGVGPFAKQNFGNLLRNF